MNVHGIVELGGKPTSQNVQVEHQLSQSQQVEHPLHHQIEHPLSHLEHPLTHQMQLPLPHQNTAPQTPGSSKSLLKSNQPQN